MFLVTPQPFTWQHDFQHSFVTTSPVTLNPEGAFQPMGARIFKQPKPVNRNPCNCNPFGATDYSALYYTYIYYNGRMCLDTN